MLTRNLPKMARRVETLSRQLASSSSATTAAVPISPDHKLTNYTVLVTGASRGIGYAIAMAAAKQGANVAILAKSETEDPRIPGTIYSAQKEIEEAAPGSKAEPIPCDVRSEEAVTKAVQRAVQRFGGIDIVINNASAISLTPASETTMKKYDLMHGVSARGTFMVSKTCLPYLKKSAELGRQPHILTISPPLTMDPKWFGPHTAYTSSKYGMSMVTLGLAEELREAGVAVNSLWPRTTIATAAVKNLLGGDVVARRSRTPAIMADAAMAVLCTPSRMCTGKFLIDDEVLRAVGVTDLSKYRVDPKGTESQLVPDFFL